MGDPISQDYKDGHSDGYARRKAEAEIINCPKCGKKMKHAKDSITKKVSKYLYKCKCLKGKVIYKG